MVYYTIGKECFLLQLYKTYLTTMKRKLLILVLSFIVIGGSLYWQHVPHRWFGYYLAPTDTLTKADAIVVVSGSQDRIKHAVDLYKQGYAPTLILSGAAREGDTSNARAMAIEATRSGVPVEAIVLEEKAANTYENALYTRDIVTAQQMKKLILVTSPYHQRRVYNTFLATFKETDARLQNSPSVYSPWHPNSWWNDPTMKHLTQTELVKLLWAKLSGNYH